MSELILDAFRHNAWATRSLIEFCQRLSDEQLNSKVPGVYGSILETLMHLIGSESYYRFLIAGRFLDWDWNEHGLVSLEKMGSWAAELADSWSRLLMVKLDPEAQLIRQTPGGRTHEARTSIVLAQVLHHGSVHREQVCTILTALGVEPPDLDVWRFGEDSGWPRRITQ